MAITIEATYENGLLRPAEPLPFAENEKLRLTVEPKEPQSAEKDADARAEENIATLAQRIAARANSLPPGALDSLPDDLAAEHDHYLYGTPKRSG